MTKILIEDTVQGRIIRLSVDADETVASILDRLRQRYRGLREASLGLVHGEDILEPDHALLGQVPSEDEQFLRFELCLLEAGGEDEAEDEADVGAGAEPTDEAVADEAVADEAVADEAVADEAVADEAVADEAVSDEAVADEAVAATPEPFVEAVAEPAGFDDEEFNSAVAAAAEPPLGDLDDWAPAASSDMADEPDGHRDEAALEDAMDAVDLTAPAPDVAPVSPRKSTSKRPPRALSVPDLPALPAVSADEVSEPPAAAVVPIARNIEPVSNTDQALEALRTGRFAEGASLLLAVRGLIDPKETAGLIQRANAEGLGFLDLLIATHRGLRETVLLSALASTMGCSWISASSLEPTPDALAALEGAASASLLAMPFEVRGDAVVVAVANPLDLGLRADLERLTGRSIIAYMALPSAISRKVKECYGEFDAAEKARAIAVAPPSSDEETRDESLSGDAPAAQQSEFDDVHDEAVALGRSGGRATDDPDPSGDEMSSPFLIAPESEVADVALAPEPEPQQVPEPAATQPDSALDAPEEGATSVALDDAWDGSASDNDEDDDDDPEQGDAPPKLAQISLSDDDALALYPEGDALISPDGFRVAQQAGDEGPSALGADDDVGLKPSARDEEFGDRTLLPVELSAAVAEAKALLTADEAAFRGESAPPPIGPHEEPDFDEEPSDETPIVDEQLVQDFNRTRKLIAKDARRPAEVDTEDLPKLKRERSTRIKLESTRLPVEGDVDAAYQGLPSSSSSVLGAVPAAVPPAAGVTLPVTPDKGGPPLGAGGGVGGASAGAAAPPVVPAPTASVPVAPGGRPVSVQAAAQVAPAAPFARRATVHYFQRMHPFQNFPLDVAVARHIAAQMGGAPRRQVVGTVHAIPAESPRLRLVPCFPGCLCVPPSIDVDVRPEETRARFQVTPLVEGKLEHARLEVYHGAERIETIELPARVVKTNVARACLVAGIGLPVFSTALELYGVQPTFEGELGRVMKDVFATLSLPTKSFFPGILLVGAALVAVSLVAYWFKRPLRAAPQSRDVQT